ncbi:MAG: HD domain-containing protein [Candidatus Aminicenantes bacterium]|nr:HD domain-containing protein [Candidatus Aminicenantes bacterium]
MENIITGFSPSSENIKRNRSEFRKLSRAFDTLKEGNFALVHSKSESVLLNSMCRVIVDLGGYPFAWVGFPGNDKYKKVLPVAHAGNSRGYLNSIELTWSHIKTDKDPVGNAIQKSIVCLDKNLNKSNGSIPWKKEASGRGFQASIAFPLIQESETLGALNVFASRPDAFDKDDINLLSALAQDLSYGIEAIRTREKKRIIEDELVRSRERIQRTIEVTVKALASTIEMRDPYTAGHQRRVADLAASIAEEMGLTKEKIDNVKIAGIIHDIGKIHIPVEILSRPGRLTESEISIIRAHPQYGHDIMMETEVPGPIADIIVEHHERINGTGYPCGKTGKEILIESKILSVADVVEAMSSHRPYRAALGIETALEEIERFKGIYYDPVVTNACLSLFKKKNFELEQDEFADWPN